MLITKFNFKTPGREETESMQMVSTTDRAATIIDGLGGADNIALVDCCATRLRVTINNGELVNEQLLKTTDAKGIIVKGNGVQVVYGPHVTTIKNEVEEALATSNAY